MNIRYLTLGLAAALLSAAPAMACDTLSGKAAKISVCVDKSWVAQEPGEGEDGLYYSDDGNIGFLMADSTVSGSAADFRQSILTGAASAGKDVKVVAERTENIGGKPWNVIEYNATADGTVFLFTEFYYVSPGFGAAAFAYWTIPDLATQAAFRAGQMMATVQFVE